MRVLGLDFGSERIGVALSDDLGMIAQPLEFVPNHPPAGVWKRLNEILRDTPYETIVVGMPRNMDGSSPNRSLAKRMTPSKSSRWSCLMRSGSRVQAFRLLAFSCLLFLSENKSHLQSRIFWRLGRVRALGQAQPHTSRTAAI